MRRILCAIILYFFGCLAIILGVEFRKTLWAGVQYHTEYVQVEAIGNPPEVPRGVMATGLVKVTDAWVFTDKARKDSKSGDYQLENDKGAVFMMTFCSPFPSFVVGDVVNILYMPQTGNCTQFFSAQRKK